MNARYIKIMVIALGLLFASQGCSFYAGFSAKQKSSPQTVNTEKTATNAQLEAENAK